MEDDGVTAVIVSDEIEAETVCGRLRAAGIECGYRPTDAVDSAFQGISGDGPREILVRASDLEMARALLADVTT